MGPRRATMPGMWRVWPGCPRPPPRSRYRIGTESTTIGNAAVLEARRLFEPRVAQLAALQGTDDLRFHLLLARATRNATVVGLMRSLLKELAIAREMALLQATGSSGAKARRAR